VSGAPLIVVFDGQCRFCSGWVRFLLPRDRGGRLRFAAMQGRAGAALLARHGLAADDLDTILRVDGDAAVLRSAAIIRAIRALGGPWRLVGLRRIVPPFLRDALYGLIARNRYRLFGRTAACMVPPPDAASRFLDCGRPSSPCPPACRPCRRRAASPRSGPTSTSARRRPRYGACA
jgi:predicted DCC family thiol-disulfide oxidoreductase YuxK